ncbi:MAG TPA: DUF4922 domain-containing protein [Melioribacteraceae bacterium]|nr:DUF4922 domain-containing protein [Melioribacteraceae bacterium]
MIDHLILNNEELSNYGSSLSLSEQMSCLLKQQYESWALLQNNYKGLETVKIKSFNFDGFEVKVQFNPSRITSSAAKVDDASIKARKSFLHYNNLPPEQKGIVFNKEYLVLCNPYPIFNEHFTIPVINQSPQTIIGKYNDFLTLTKEIADRYVVFYNGPKCGASAPDHMHFQAGNKNFMPLDTEYDLLINKFGNLLFSQRDIKIYSVNKYLRNFIAIESNNFGIAEKYFYSIIDAIKVITSDENEPMLNILGYYKNNNWITVIFPREKHRPTYYFEEGEKNILLSPASVDMGGVCITPLEKDFEKITKEEVIDIYKQVSVADTKFSDICKTINNFD